MQSYIKSSKLYYIQKNFTCSNVFMIMSFKKFTSLFIIKNCIHGTERIRKTLLKFVFIMSENYSRK